MIVLAILEQMGLPRQTIGYVFLVATILLYAGIGIISRTNDAAEYYVAGRRVPAMFNGMAIGADWMSAASFIGMAGTLYLRATAAWPSSWAGPAATCWWRFCWRRTCASSGSSRFPDFLGARYGGQRAALHRHRDRDPVLVHLRGGADLRRGHHHHAASAAWPFEVGIFLGLAGILVCSFLGGMRAVTWTQVAQYIILIIAYMVPVVWLSVKQTGFPIPQLVYGQQLQKVTQLEQKLIADPKENEVRKIFSDRATAAEKSSRTRRRRMPKEGPRSSRRSPTRRRAAMRRRSRRPRTRWRKYPKDEAAARAAWTQGARAGRTRRAADPRHAEAFRRQGREGAQRRRGATSSR